MQTCARNRINVSGIPCVRNPAKFARPAASLSGHIDVNVKLGYRIKYITTLIICNPFMLLINRSVVAWWHFFPRRVASARNRRLSLRSATLSRFSHCGKTRCGIAPAGEKNLTALNMQTLRTYCRWYAKIYALVNV